MEEYLPKAFKHRACEILNLMKSYVVLEIIAFGLEDILGKRGFHAKAIVDDVAGIPLTQVGFVDFFLSIHIKVRAFGMDLNPNSDMPW